MVLHSLKPLLPPAMSVQRIALPLLGAALAEPLLSTIDTAAVGRLALSPATDLAALSINSALFNIIAASTSFFCTATTNLLGSHDTEQAAIFNNGLVLALAVGAVLTVALFALSPAVFRSVYQLEPGSQVFRAARRYMAIRALACPAATATLVGAGVCFGLRDTDTPLVAIGIAAAANLLGDAILVPLFGLSGAAAATAVASYTAAVIVVRRLTRRLKPTWRWPRARELKPFVSISAALLSGTLLNSLTYAGTTSIVAADAGNVAAIATHQVALQSWWLLSFVSVPLSLAAQSLLPPMAVRALGAVAPTNTTEGSVTAIEVAALDTWRHVLALLGLSASLSIVLCAANCLLATVFAPVFSSDKVVRCGLRSILPQLALSQIAINVATALDGAYIGCGRLTHYVSVSLVSCLATACVFFAGGSGLGVAWWGMVAFSAVRCLSHTLGLAALRRHLFSRAHEGQPGAEERGVPGPAATVRATLGPSS